MDDSLCPQAWYPVLFIAAARNGQNPLNFGDNDSLHECMKREMRRNDSFKPEDYDVYDRLINMLKFSNSEIEHAPLDDADAAKKRKISISAASGSSEHGVRAAAGASATDDAEAKEGMFL